MRSLSWLVRSDCSDTLSISGDSARDSIARRTTTFFIWIHHEATRKTTYKAGDASGIFSHSPELGISLGTLKASNPSICDSRFSGNFRTHITRDSVSRGDDHACVRTRTRDAAATSARSGTAHGCASADIKMVRSVARVLVRQRRIILLLFACIHV